MKGKGKDNITWKFLSTEGLESSETSSVTWPSSEQWRCLSYKIKALWESSSREMSGSIYCLAPVCLCCISAFCTAPNNTSQVQTGGRVSFLSELAYLIHCYHIRSEFCLHDSHFIIPQSKVRQSPTIFAQLFPLSQKVIFPSFIFKVMRLVKKVLYFFTFLSLYFLFCIGAWRQLKWHFFFFKQVIYKHQFESHLINTNIFLKIGF